MNYGGDKEQYYNVLNTLGWFYYFYQMIIDYHYNVMTQDFSIDLPHPPYRIQAIYTL